jgi:hypothetical protein
VKPFLIFCYQSRDYDLLEQNYLKREFEFQEIKESQQEIEESYTTKIKQLSLSVAEVLPPSSSPPDLTGLT